MDLAIQAPSIQEAQSVTLDEAKRSAGVYTRRILKIETFSSTPESNHIQDNTYFSTVSTKLAIEIISNELDGNISAVLLNPDFIDDDIAKLREVTRAQAVPLFVYTTKFNQDAKEAALKISADDYHYGAISTGLYKRIDFVKKIKAYKKQRGAAPYTTLSVDAVPQIKLWSLKRAFDIVVSASILLALSPLLLLIALIIKLESRGPIFYISKRAGTNYRIFDFYKFRSMRVGADKELQKLAHLNQYGPKNAFFKIKNDPRITKFGQFLRNTSLDEIPQLFNVLIGDMSLVGNRPLPLYEAEKLTKDQIAWRFLAPAGITGLWQITKRGKEDMSEEERIALDMEYAMKNSFLLDIKIMLKTVPALLQKEKV
ncbi:sugar transferase [Chryseosolibacter indicus]|uniref:Sugar transferase n=1 Tax=Chryseosolibacter indicus TaxID=2782351 RepID=A0ABS5VP47_9BACT|nr:sugar transferase [Chryseosolibacter indicus]MBT1702577.1 sugar transferase [Chryseosolibacter indicus]